MLTRRFQRFAALAEGLLNWVLRRALIFDRFTPPRRRCLGYEIVAENTFTLYQSNYSYEERYANHALQTD
jgi:hypothetical protein